MSYFRLFPDVILIEGNCRCALYFLTEERVIHLEKEESKIMSQLRTRSIETTYNYFDRKMVDRLIQYLIKHALGTIYSGDVYSESYIPNMPFELKGYLESPLTIEELSIELYPKDLYRIWSTNPKVIFQGCNSCIPATNLSKDNSLNIKKLQLEIQNTTELKIKEVILHVGDLQSHKDDIAIVIETLRKTHPKIGIGITTYLEEIDNETISFLKKTPYLRVAACFEAKTIDAFSPFFLVCRSLRDAGIPVTLNAVFSHQDHVNRYNTAKRIAGSLDCQLRTTEIIHNSDDHVYSISRGKSRIEKTNSDTFYARQRYSICQYGKLAIDASGKIGCCLYGRKTGNLDRGIYDWLSRNEHKKGWESPKRRAGICKHCENRLACIDCALLEQLSKTEPELYKTICAYNPSSGAWEL